MKSFQVIGFLVIFCGSLLGQTIKGQFSQMPNQFISLIGFNNYTEEVIGSLNTDAEGKFEFQYNASQFGIGYLKLSDEAKLKVLLNGEDIVVKGIDINDKETISIEQGAENKTLRTYSVEHPKRLSVLDAWSFLNNYYSFDPQFSQNSNVQKLILEELNRVNSEEITFIPITQPGDDLNFLMSHIKSMDFTVLNRWGQTLYASKDQLPNWNGRSMDTGEVVSSGTYFWIFNYSDVSGKSVSINGYVQVSQ